MAQIIKRPFRTFNGKDWDTHHFETSANQVFLNDGTNAQIAIKNTTTSNLAIAGSIALAEEYVNEINLSQNGIVTINFGVRYYIKDSNGLVTGQQLFTLPVDLRPKGDLIIPALAVRVGALANTIGYLYVRKTGAVTFALVGDQTAYSQVCGCVNFSIN